MHRYLKIHDIYIDFNYQFNDFFSSAINAYEIPHLPKNYHQLNVSIKDHIYDDTTDQLLYQNKTRHIYESKTTRTIVTYTNDHQDIKHIITYTKDYKHIHIILNQKLGQRLAEYEYVLTGFMFMEIAVSRNYLPMHASAFSIGGHTMLLSGPSKSGKSTQTRFFKNTFDDMFIINEDKPLLFLKDDQCYAIGSPWSGKDVINNNAVKEVDALFFINQADTLGVYPLTDKEKITHVFKNIQKPLYEHFINHILETINQVIKHVKMYRFDCINEDRSATYLYQFMEGRHENQKPLCN